MPKEGVREVFQRIRHCWNLTGKSRCSHVLYCNCNEWWPSPACIVVWTIKLLWVFLLWVMIKTIVVPSLLDPLWQVHRLERALCPRSPKTAPDSKLRGEMLKSEPHVRLDCKACLCSAHMVKSRHLLIHLKAEKSVFADVSIKINRQLGQKTACQSLFLASKKRDHV